LGFSFSSSRIVIFSGGSVRNELGKERALYKYKNGFFNGSFFMADPMDR